MIQPSDLSDDIMENLLILNYAARLMASMTDREVLLTNGMECIADFCRGRRSAIVTWDQQRERFLAERLFLDRRVLSIRRKVSIPEIFAGDTDVLCKASVQPCCLEGDIPLPGPPDSPDPLKCLFLPLVSTNHSFVGVTIIVLDDDFDPSHEDMQNLRMLTTVLAIALENARLFQQAVCDGLTGAFLRRFYEIRLNEELARLKRKPGVLSVLFLDIDRFKAVNDRFGHQTGDGVLRELVQLLKRNMRQGIDVIARYGGDEFIVLMPGADLSEALTAGERLCALCRNRAFGFLPGEMNVTLSGGVISLNETGMLEPDELFRRVDAALYRAKQLGGDGITVASGDG